MTTQFRLVIACASLATLAACGGHHSSPTQDTQPAAPPSAPASASAAAADGQITVTWASVSGATSYNLYWSTASGVSKANGTKIAGATSPYVHAGLTNGTVYYYVVTAVNAGGESAESTAVSATPLPAVPAAPTGVSATPGDGQVTVSWSAASGAASYNLYWSTTPGVTRANGTKIAGASSPYVQVGRINGTAYYYVVTAVNAGGESAESAQVSAVPAGNPPPAAPTGVTATPGDGQVTVTWAVVSGATSYNVYWSTTAGVTQGTGTKIASVTSPYLHTGLTDGITYHYVVTAVNANGESTDSAEASATPVPPAPAAPTGVGAVGADSQVTVSWSPASGATSYNLYWSTTPGVTKANGTQIAGASSPYVHAGRTNGTTYYYVVTAVNAGGESAESQQVSAMAMPGLPGAPVGLTATAGAGQVTLQWSAVASATSYNAYWSTSPGVTPSTGTRITGVTSPYVHTGLSWGPIYYYVVTAVNLAGESAPSAEASAAPRSAVYAVSGSVSAAAGSGRIYVEIVPSSCPSCVGQYGTSMADPGAFTIRGVIPGSYVAHAYRDTLGYGARNATFPTGTSPAFTVLGSDVSGVAVTLATVGVPLPAVPGAFSALPGDGAAFVSWDAVTDLNGDEAVTGYDVAWGTDAAASTGGGTASVPAHDDPGMLLGLTNGTAYYVKVRATNGATTGAWTTPVGPFTPGAPGGNTVSGTITLPVTPTGPLYVALAPPNAQPTYVKRIASPSASQPYSITGVLPGTYQLYALLDQDGNGVVDPGDVSNMNGAVAATLVTVAGSTVKDLTLSSAAGVAAVSTQHGVTAAGDAYDLELRVSDGTKLVVNATLTSGAGVTTPVDLARASGYDLSVTLGAVHPSVGAVYGFDVTYADGTTASLNASVGAVLDACARNLTVTPTPDATTPTFSWMAPSPEPAGGYGYYISVDGPSVSWWYPGVGRMPSTQTSVLYDVDQGSTSPSLTPGTTYGWSIVVEDASWNTCAVETTYTP